MSPRRNYFSKAGLTTDDMNLPARPALPVVYYSVSEVAAMLAVSDDTVIRLFAHREGVIDLGSPETMHKRKKRLLRISRAALDLFLSEMQVKVRRA